jgi:hypothetical protein
LGLQPRSLKPLGRDPPARHLNRSSLPTQHPSPSLGRCDPRPPNNHLPRKFFVPFHAPNPRAVHMNQKSIRPRSLPSPSLRPPSSLPVTKINLVDGDRAEREGSASEETNVNSPIQADEWRCPACDTLIGVKSEGRLHIRYKAINLLVCGAVIVVCRKCSQINALDNTQTAEKSA